MINEYGSEITGTVAKLLTTNQIIERLALVFDATKYDFSELEEFTEVCATASGDEMLMMQFRYDDDDDVFEEVVIACNRFLITGTTEITIEDCSDLLTLDLLALDAKLEEALASVPTGNQPINLITSPFTERTQSPCRL